MFFFEWLTWTNIFSLVGLWIEPQLFEAKQSPPRKDRRKQFIKNDHIWWKGTWKWCQSTPPFELVMCFALGIPGKIGWTIWDTIFRCGHILDIGCTLVMTKGSQWFDWRFDCIPEWMFQRNFRKNTCQRWGYQNWKPNQPTFFLQGIVFSSNFAPVFQYSRYHWPRNLGIWAMKNTLAVWGIQGISGDHTSQLKKGFLNIDKPYKDPSIRIQWKVIHPRSLT